MKHIGYTSADSTPTKWGRNFPAGPMKLFIPEPGEREQINADHYRHVGWITPGAGREPVESGVVYSTHAEAGPDSRPAYVKRDTAPTGMIVADGPIRVQGFIDPMDVRRSEFEAHAARLEKLEQICRPDLVARGVLSSGAAAKLAMSKEYGEIGRPLPSTIPTGKLLSEATEFCAEELDGYADLDGDSEINCQRSATYIRELVRRLSEHREALRPFTAAGADGRGSALPDSDPLAIISANMPDLPHWIAKARGVVTMGDVRRALQLFKDETP